MKASSSGRGNAQPHSKRTRQQNPRALYARTNARGLWAKRESGAKAERKSASLEEGTNTRMQTWKSQTTTRDNDEQSAKCVDDNGEAPEVK